MTSAEAQAFKRACSVFGLGRYFYNFAEMWVDIDEYKHPRELPPLPSWALPENERRAPVRRRSGQEGDGQWGQHWTKGTTGRQSHQQVEGSRRDLGHNPLRIFLDPWHEVRSARDIPNQRIQQEVLKWMESGERGVAQVRRVAAEIPETELYGILDDLSIPRLDEIPNFGVLVKLVERMNEAQSRRPAA